jgi:hypothetical protein
MSRSVFVIDFRPKALYTISMKIAFLLIFSLLAAACSKAPQLPQLPQVIIVPAGSTPPSTSTPTFTPTPEGMTPSPTPSATITPTPTFSCPNAPESKLKVGDAAQVTETKAPSVRLRKDPLVNNKNIIKLLAEGTKFTIIGGPECAVVPDTGGAFIFWQIQIPGDPVTGWVAEGDAKGYFIEPVPTTNPE